MPAKQYRGFSVVIHDIQKHMTLTKELVESHMQNIPALEWVIAQEEYTHQEGSHMHIFYRCDKRTFGSQLKFWLKIVDNEECRVQVDVMKGSMDQACKYLQPGNTSKFKYYDGNGVHIRNEAECKEERLKWVNMAFPDALKKHPWFYIHECIMYVEGKYFEKFTKKYLLDMWDYLNSPQIKDDEIAWNNSMRKYLQDIEKNLRPY